MPLPELHPVNRAAPDVVRLRAEIEHLKKRIATLERENRIPVTTVAGVTGGRDGALAASEDTPRLWVKIGGTWRYTALT